MNVVASALILVDCRAFNRELRLSFAPLLLAPCASTVCRAVGVLGVGARSGTRFVPEVLVAVLRVLPRGGQK